MINTKRTVISLVTVLLFSAVPMTALAKDTATGRSISPNPPQPVQNDGTSNTTADDNQLHVKDLTKTNQQNGQTKLEAEKATVKEKPQADRTKACDDRQADIQKRMSNAVKLAKFYQTRFDNVFSKAKTYHDSHSLSVTNYDALVASLTTDQQNVSASIASLSSLDVTPECSAPDTAASSVSAFREAVQTTRDDLKQYRSDLVKLLQALKAANSNNSTSQ